MNVMDLMSKPVCCDPETTLAAAAEMLWKDDCGALPVVDRGGRTLGMITDRDICIALGTRNRCAGEMTAGEIAREGVHAVRPEASLDEALETMAAHKVRRLPVIGEDGRLMGVIALNDIILCSGKRTGEKDKGLGAEKVMTALRAICAHSNGKGTRAAA